RRRALGGGAGSRAIGAARSREEPYALKAAELDLEVALAGRIGERQRLREGGIGTGIVAGLSLRLGDQSEGDGLLEAGAESAALAQHRAHDRDPLHRVERGVEPRLVEATLGEVAGKAVPLADLDAEGGDLRSRFAIVGEDRGLRRPQGGVREVELRAARPASL